jgi:hypothetical protein
MYALQSIIKIMLQYNSKVLVDMSLHLDTVS